MRSLPSLAAFCARCCTTFSERPRPNTHDRQLEPREHRHRQVSMTRRSDDNLVVERAQRQRPREHMRERQEHQQPLTLRSSVGSTALAPRVS